MPTAAIHPSAPPVQTLFGPDLRDQLLLSIRVMGKVTAAQLARLHREEIRRVQDIGTTPVQFVRKTLEGLVKEGLLVVIQPIDIEQPNLWRNLPKVYLDSWAGRRRVEELFGVSFRRPPEVPSPDYRFLFHDMTMTDDLVSWALTADRRGLSYGYQTHFDPEGDALYPKVTVTDGSLTHSVRPQPDKTPIIGQHHVVHEHDCGQEQISLGNIIRDNSLARKTLVYEAVEASGALDRLGWGSRLYTFIINGQKRTKKSSRVRIKTTIEALPATVNPARFYFIDRQTHQEAGDDVSGLTWLRGDGRAMRLPCWGRG